MCSCSPYVCEALIAPLLDLCRPSVWNMGVVPSVGVYYPFEILLIFLNSCKVFIFLPFNVLQILKCLHTKQSSSSVFRHVTFISTVTSINLYSLGGENWICSVGA